MCCQHTEHKRQQTTTAQNALKHTSVVGTEFCTPPANSHHTLSRHAAFHGVPRLDCGTRTTMTRGSGTPNSMRHSPTLTTANSARTQQLKVGTGTPQQKPCIEPSTQNICISVVINLWLVNELLVKRASKMNGNSMRCTLNHRWRQTKHACCHENSVMASQLQNGASCCTASHQSTTNSAPTNDSAFHNGLHEFALGS